MTKKKNYYLRIIINSSRKTKTHETKITWSTPGSVHPDYFFRDSWYRILPFWHESTTETYIKVHSLKKGDNMI